MVNLNLNSNSNYNPIPSYPFLTPKPNPDLTFPSLCTTFPQAFSANSLCYLSEAHFFRLDYVTRVTLAACNNEA